MSASTDQPSDHSLSTPTANPLLPVALYDLTRREQEILYLVADGATNRLIAKQLGVSPRTVQKHLEHVYHKLQVKTRTAAAVMLLRRPSSVLR